MEITVDELVNARVEALIREELIKSNANYEKEIAGLEHRITETQLRVECVEREIQSMSNFVEQVGNDKMKVYKSLLEENKSLKKIHAEASELKFAAQASLCLKELFKKKYEEAIVGYTSPESLTDTSDQNIALEIEVLQQKLQETEAQAAEVIKEKEYMKKKVIPVLENTLKLYEKNKSESEERIDELKLEIKNKLKRGETHSASPVSSKSRTMKPSASTSKCEASGKITAKSPKSKAYQPSYLTHSKTTIKRSDRNSK